MKQKATVVETKHLSAKFVLIMSFIVSAFFFFVLAMEQDKLNARIRELEIRAGLGDKCPRCGTLFLFNNRTFAGVCDNCWNDEVQKAQRRLAKKYGGKR
jgi:hypothetical protein